MPDTSHCEPLNHMLGETGNSARRRTTGTADVPILYTPPLDHRAVDPGV